MPPTIRFKSENYAGKTARVTFIPNDSGVPPLDLGLHTLPSDYTPPTELYSGEYRFNFEDLEKICSASILAPTPSPTPTVTPTPPWTPTPTPTLTQTPTVTQTRTSTPTPTLTPTPTTAPAAVTVLHLRGEGLDGQQNNTFQDSANNFSVTRTGTVTQGSFTPFTAAGVTYNPSAHSGSGYFDRNSFLTASAAISLFTGTSWTIEAWVYMLPGGTQYTLINSVPHSVIDISLNRTGSGDTYVYIGNGTTWTGGGPSIIANAFLSFNIWHHIALVRNGATITLYQNGVNVGSTTNLPSGYSGPLYIGSIGGAEYFNGFISNLRTTIHAAYTTFFTRPASPVTLTSNGGATPSVLPSPGQVSLLCNFTNGGVIDSACRHDVTTVGNSKISTTLSRCNEGSISFDGNGDYLTIPSSSDFAFGTGDFTVEAWVYPTGTTGYKAIFSTRSAVITTPSSFIVGLNTGNTSAFWYANGFLLVNARNISLGTWAHVAVSRQGTTLRLFIDGVLVSSAFNNDNLTSTLGTVGANADGSEPFIGNIDNLKITKNTALYTTNFTPSDCPPPSPTPTRTPLPPTPTPSPMAGTVIATGVYGSVNTNDYNEMNGGTTDPGVKVWYDRSTDTYKTNNKNGITTLGITNWGTSRAGTTVDFSGAQKLTTVSFWPSYFRGSSINLSNCPELTNIDCYVSVGILTSLNITNCPKLTRLNAYVNSGLQTVDISGCNELTDIILYVGGLTQAAIVDIVQKLVNFGKTNGNLQTHGNPGSSGAVTAAAANIATLTSRGWTVNI
jgi:hypothetical protein